MFLNVYVVLRSKANIENESFTVAVAVYACHLMILSGSRWCVCRLNKMTFLLVIENILN